MGVGLTIQSHKSQDVKKILLNQQIAQEDNMFLESSISRDSGQSFLENNSSDNNNPKDKNSTSNILGIQSSGYGGSSHKKVKKEFERARAKYAFKAQKDKDLSFNVGDEIIIEKKRNNGWWVGLCNGRRGYFPNNYVELIEEGIGF